MLGTIVYIFNKFIISKIKIHLVSKGKIFGPDCTYIHAHNVY